MVEVRIADWIVEKVLITKEKGGSAYIPLMEQLRNEPIELENDIRESLPGFITDAMLEGHEGVVHGDDFSVTSREVVEKLKELDRAGKL